MRINYEGFDYANKFKDKFEEMLEETVNEDFILKLIERYDLLNADNFDNMKEESLMAKVFNFPTASEAREARDVNVIKEVNLCLNNLKKRIESDLETYQFTINIEGMSELAIEKVQNVLLEQGYIVNINKHIKTDVHDSESYYRMDVFIPK